MGRKPTHILTDLHVTGVHLVKSPINEHCLIEPAWSTCVWFVFNDGSETYMMVDLPLHTFYHFNEQRPKGSENKRGLYVARECEEVSTLFRLQAVGVNETEFIYEETPQLPLRERWRVQKESFKRRCSMLKKSILTRIKKRMKINHHYREIFGGES